MINILFLIAYLKFGASTMENIVLEDYTFAKKKEYFQKFINNKSSINLILGSSLIEDCLIPDSLSSRWYSFSNNGQNIYESYIFLEYCKDLIGIDTIILGIQPFDFPFSYIDKFNEDSRLPHSNGQFYFFSVDSITRIRTPKYLSKKFIQQKKQEIYPTINEYLGHTKTFQNKSRFISEQGFTGRKHLSANNIDSLYINSNLKVGDPNLFYSNLSDDPNFKYFDLFNKSAIEMGIKVIYLSTPKSKPYFMELTKLGLDKMHLKILYGIRKRNVEFWNYENFTNKIPSKLLYWNESHLTFKGAQIFTKMIKKRLIN